MGVADLHEEGQEGKTDMFLKDALFSRTSIPAVAKSLDAAALRGRAIANNLANVTTPGYQRIEVAFEDQLRMALDEKKLKGTVDQPGHIPLGRPDLDQVMPVAYRSQDPTMPGEINNVDVDMEAAKLAENQMLFNFGVKFIQDRKGAIESAISGQPR
jgi:flagellar basal-body rod protein FlgB